MEELDEYKIGYSFDVNKEYSGEVPIWLEHRTGRYPHADNVVLIAPPPTREHEKAFWIGDNWEIRIDEGYVEDGDIIRKMTLVERIEVGLDKLPDNKKIVDNKLVEKTRDDYFNEGKMTVEEYNAGVDHDRRIRYEDETDGLGWKYIRGECTLEEWKSAMDKIREKLPKK